MKILCVATAWPWPPRKGHQLRSLQLASLLAERHEVTLLVPDGGEAPPGLPYAVERYRAPGRAPLGAIAAAAASGRSLQSGLFASGDLARRLGDEAARADLTLLQTTRQSGLLRALGGAPAAVDLIDSLSLNLERRAMFDHPLLRPLLRFEAGRLAADERRMIAATRRALVVCARDRAHISSRLPRDLAARLAVVPLVGTSSAPPTERPAASGFRISITGNLGYFPTAHGIGWFLDEVWPLLRARLPEARLRVAGSRPSRRLARRLRESGAELVLDPPEMAAELAAADVAIAPLHAGSGVPVKLLEAILAGVPVLATSWAAAGLEPELAARVATADGRAAWVDVLAELAREPGDARRRAMDLQVKASDLHSRSRASESLEDALQEVGKGPIGTPASRDRGARS